jgi:hypothetical protein
VATHTAMQQLELVKEAKIFDVLEGSIDPRLEASGVLAKDGRFYVIFDNLPHIACIGPELARASRDNHMIMQEYYSKPHVVEKKKSPLAASNASR